MRINKKSNKEKHKGNPGKIILKKKNFGYKIFVLKKIPLFLNK